MEGELDGQMDSLTKLSASLISSSSSSSAADLEAGPLLGEAQMVDRLQDEIKAALGTHLTGASRSPLERSSLIPLRRPSREPHARTARCPQSASPRSTTRCSKRRTAAARRRTCCIGTARSWLTSRLSSGGRATRFLASGNRSSCSALCGRISRAQRSNTTVSTTPHPPPHLDSHGLLTVRWRLLAQLNANLNA